MSIGGIPVCKHIWPALVLRLLTSHQESSSKLEASEQALCMWLTTMPYFGIATALEPLTLCSLISTGSFSPTTGLMLVCKYDAHKQHLLGSTPLA